MSRPFFLLTGGGTSGHISPALAVAEELQKRFPGCRILYAGTDRGLEKKVVPAAGYDFMEIDACPIPFKPSLAMVKAAITLNRSANVCTKILKDLKPDAVFATGGYVCAPILIAAGRCSIPYVIHEQNAFPGRNNRLMARKADVVCLAYKEAESHFHAGVKTVFTGNPVRKDFLLRLPKGKFTSTFKNDDENNPEYSEEVCKVRNKLNISTSKPMILISGGSLGAKSLNMAALEWKKKFGKDHDITLVLVTGRQYEATVAKSKELGLSSDVNLQIRPFLNNMIEYLMSADLIIGRSGASTCAEIACLGKAAVFIPYPYAASDHQTYNARVPENAGAAFCIPDAEWNCEQMEKMVLLTKEPSKIINMEKNSRKLYVPTASSKIVDEIIKAAHL